MAYLLSIKRADKAVKRLWGGSGVPEKGVA
jgi:hypothetical protein